MFQEKHTEDHVHEDVDKARRTGIETMAEDFFPFTPNVPPPYGTISHCHGTAAEPARECRIPTSVPLERRDL